MEITIKNYRLYTPIDEFGVKTPYSDHVGYRCNLSDARFDKDGVGKHDPDCLVSEVLNDRRTKP